MDELIAILKSNARASNSDIAKELGISEEAVSAQIAELEGQGIIKGYQPILNEDALPKQTVRAMIEVQVTPEREGGFDTISNRIGRFPEVVSMYLMSGAYDLILLVEGDDLKKVASFVSEKLSTIPGVTGTATHFMLKTYKYRGVMMESEDEYERLKVSP